MHLLHMIYPQSLSAVLRSLRPILIRLFRFPIRLGLISEYDIPTYLVLLSPKGNGIGRALLAMNPPTLQEMPSAVRLNADYPKFNQTNLQYIAPL